MRHSRKDWDPVIEVMMPIMDLLCHASLPSMKTCPLRLEVLLSIMNFGRIATHKLLSVLFVDCFASQRASRHGHDFLAVSDSPTFAAEPDLQLATPSS